MESLDRRAPPAATSMGPDDPTDLRSGSADGPMRRPEEDRVVSLDPRVVTKILCLIATRDNARERPPASPALAS